jgi:hypothetical protein
MHRTTCTNWHLGAAAVAVAADAALAETSIELPPANNIANAAFSEVPTDNKAEAAALADTSLVASGKIACLVSADALLQRHTTHIYLFICSLYSFIMCRTTFTNRHLGAAAVAVAADVALAETSIELPPANNPANAAFLEVPTDNNAEAAALADTSLLASGMIACLVSADALLQRRTTHIYSFIR